MKASEVIKILSLCPDADVTVWSYDRKEEMNVVVSVNDEEMQFCITEAPKCNKG